MHICNHISCSTSNILVRCGNWKASPVNCTGTVVPGTDGYSAGQIVRIRDGMQVSRSTDKDSCPPGYKIWSPRNQKDWKIVWNALGKSKNNYPNNTVIDVTHPYDNYCPGCNDYPMNSNDGNIGKGKLWRTSDGTDWWLRDSKFSEPSGDYSANCYITVTNPVPDNLQFNDYDCSTLDGKITPFSKTSEYFCQIAQGKQ